MLRVRMAVLTGVLMVVVLFVLDALDLWPHSSFRAGVVGALCAALVCWLGRGRGYRA